MENSKKNKDYLINKNVTEKHLNHLETLEDISLDQYKILYKSNQIKRLVKFKKEPKKIYWDNPFQQFVYWNGFTQRLNKCAVFLDRIDSNGNLKPLNNG
jgi:hypothetical protein|tara:strand:- start:127 stop:423 length:297 start_codon:yes stop_codon:yes gene_type:complete